MGLYWRSLVSIPFIQTHQKGTPESVQWQSILVPLLYMECTSAVISTTDSSGFMVISHAPDIELQPSLADRGAISNPEFTQRELVIDHHMLDTARSVCIVNPWNGCFQM